MACSQLYIGTNRPIPASSSEVFTVEPLDHSDRDYASVSRALGSAHVAYLAPHTGCGCGWDYLQVGTPNDELSRESVEALGRFLRSSSFYGQPKLYSVSLNRVGALPVVEQRLTPDNFMARLGELRVPYTSSEARLYILAPNNSSKPTPLRGAA